MSAKSEAKASKFRRQPVARHGALSSPNPFVQVLTILGAMLVVAAVSVAAIGGFYVWDASRALDETSVSLGNDELPPHIGEIEGGVNMLVVGTDSCEGQDLKLFPRCAHDDGGERNDVTMLVHISDSPRRVTVVSFPRDMIVPIPSCENPEGGAYPAMSAQMINASYMYGGLPCTVTTVEELTGVDIQFAAAIRWTGVINMSDAIGGVDVCLSGDVKDRHTGLDLKAGEHTLVGAEALQFLRIRHGIGDGSDLGRISNQQQFMGSLVRKLQSGAVLSNYPVLLNLANTAVRQVNEGQLVLSESLSNPQRMVQIAMAVSDVSYEDIKFVQYPTVYAPGGGRVLPVTSDADQLFAALAENKPIALTGEVSGGNGVEVVGEAGGPTPAPTDGPSGTPSATPDATATPPADGDAAVELPSGITGQSAAQVTCTRAQG
ncbi:MULTISPECIES: LCP family protein [unclassified Microbacterium]|uniref:LCP family protein n=1 Tax=unclassified Microbacterium TaxID=2609290 RepID=UPI0038670EDB